MERAEKIQIVQELIALSTVNGHELALAKYLKDLFARYHLAAEIQELGDERANLYLRVGSKQGPALGFTGHMDTVAVSNPKAWEQPPFQGKLIDGKIVGRGAADMKSGLAAQVIAMIELVQAGQLPDQTAMVLIATAGEELGAQGAYQLPKKALEDLVGLVVGEPTNGDVVYAHSGSLNYQVESYGRAAHSSTPNQGINAITSLLAFCQLENQVLSQLPLDPLLGAVQHSITMIEGGQQVNIVPDRASLWGNIRPTQRVTNEDIQDYLGAMVAKVNQEQAAQLALKIVHNFYPVATQPHNPLVLAALAASQTWYGTGQAKLKRVNLASDASVFTQLHPDLPIILLGADEAGSAHQVDEYVTVDRYLDLINVYKSLTVNYLAAALTNG